MTDRPAFVAVDWGTSSLRVWLMAASGAVLAETRSSDGMGGLDPAGFEAVLRARLADLGPAFDALPRPVPVILCGMVGARQGWREAPYVDIPAPLSALAAKTVTVPADGLDLRILPGLCRRIAARPDVLRGEETQLLGLVLDHPALTATVCLPGTHSKWVTLDHGRVADFQTAMTGELFAILAQHSILRHTLAGATPTGDPASPAFRAGLADALAAPAAALSHLFALRAAGLLFGLDGAAAADRLSGQMIGAELALVGPSDAPILLVASGRLAGLYAAAFTVAGWDATLVDADDAVRAGLLHAARAIWDLPAP